MNGIFLDLYGFLWIFVVQVASTAILGRGQILSSIVQPGIVAGALRSKGSFS